MPGHRSPCDFSRILEELAVKFDISHAIPRSDGLPGGNRTPDPQLRRLLLYPTELRAEIERNCGRGERIRTFDPLVPNQMRYQAALRPDMYVLYRVKRPISDSHKHLRVNNHH